MILVTGATGFLGSELVKQLLLKGLAVRALKRENSLIPQILQDKKGIEWFNADISDYFAVEEAFEGIKQVYHCSAKVSFDPSDKKKMHKVNVEGTSHIVNLCHLKGIEKLVYVSSVAAIGEAKRGKLITEKNNWEFNIHHSAYSLSKYESEMIVWRGIAEGLNAVIVNPSIIIGKNAGIKGSGQIFARVKKGLNFYTEGSCGLVDVEDVAKTMILLMEGDFHSERFIINSENWKYLDLFAEIAFNLKKQPPAYRIKPWMLELAWRGTHLISAFTGKQNNITKDTARNAFKMREYSNLKIKEALNITFKPIEQSIREICEIKETSRT